MLNKKINVKSKVSAFVKRLQMYFNRIYDNRKIISSIKDHVNLNLNLTFAKLNLVNSIIWNVVSLMSYVIYTSQNRKE